MPSHTDLMLTDNPHDLKIIAYYLPQFHPVAENDEWWGPGFTEWTNVTKAQPYFKGHEQPQYAGEMGYYDLRVPEVRERQAELARAHGIHGFCYYYYWFAGRRILERPLQDMLDSGRPDFPFCICWANESWSRRWDGSEDELLIAQRHDTETDIAFIRDVIPLFGDPRYIKMDGKPVLLVYRTGLFPKPQATAEVWRKICQEEGFPDVHLVSVSTFGAGDPRPIGFDAACEFPPHGLVAGAINDRLEDLDPGFSGQVYDYGDVVEAALRAPAPGYECYRGVMTSWDNTPRRGRAGNVFTGTHPALFERWLRAVAAQAVDRLPEQRRLVFVNAWNEWAESAHLEPDQRWGRAYLEAVRRVVSGRGDWTQDLALLRELYAQAPAARDALDNLERQLTGLSRANGYLSQLDSVLTASTYGTVAVDAEPDAWADAEPSRGAFGTVDQINQFRAGDPAAIRQGTTLCVFGWMLAAGCELTASTPVWVVLRERASGREWYAPVWQRHERSDVEAHRSDLPGSQTRWSGFRAFIDTRLMLPGDYGIGLATLSGRRLLVYQTSRRVHLR